MNNSDQHLSDYLKKLRTVFNKGFDTYEDTISKNISRIEISSSLLEMSEYQFFQIAHKHWFGFELPDRDMDSVYTDYLYRSIIPAWACHLAHRVLSLYYEGAFQSMEVSIN